MRSPSESITGRRGGPRRESRLPCAPGKAKKVIARDARFLIDFAPESEARRAETAFFSGLGLYVDGRAADAERGALVHRLRFPMN